MWSGAAERRVKSGCQPVDNTSVNPARSTGVALFQGGWAVQPLWLFWVMPLLGGAAGGLIYRLPLEERGASR